MAWSHYNSIPCRRLFHIWVYCIPKTIPESSLSATWAEKVLKNLLVYLWFTENLQNIRNDLRAGTFSFARKKNMTDRRCISNSFFVAYFWIYKHRRIQIDYGLATNEHIDESKARLYDHQGGEAYYLLLASYLLQLDAKDIVTFCVSIDSLDAPCTSTPNVTIYDYVSWQNPIFLVRPESLSNFLVAWTRLWPALSLCLSVHLSVGP